MRVFQDWKDYTLIDCSNGERLERWGDQVLIRPDPQVIWKTPKTHPLWKAPHAIYHRANTGGGQWEQRKPMPAVWEIGLNGLRFRIKTMGFKHTGLFPEQAVNWRLTAEVVRRAGKPLKVLNLFAYTGGATLAALQAGAQVTHVDASKGMTLWAKENAAASGLADRPVRWLVDDCIKFVQRELRRGNSYDIIIMDPPSYGRGPGGEVWKLENEVYDFVALCAQLLAPDAQMMLINSYTTGLSPSVMEYILGETVQRPRGGATQSDEIGLPVQARPGRVLPCGATAIWRSDACALGEETV